MRYLSILILTLILVTVSCRQDDFDFEGPALSFFPTVVQSGSEEDGITYLLPLEVSGFIEGTAYATVTVDMTAEGVITTNPPLNGNKIQLELTNTNEAVILVTIANDAVPDDYIATFRISSVGGELVGIGKDKFTLFVEDKDFAPYFSENFNECSGSNLFSFTAYSVTGDQVWGCLTTFGLGGSNAARMNGYSGGNRDNEDWLISPAYDLTPLDYAAVSFYSDRSFTGPDIELRVSTDYTGSGNPNDATWVALAPKLDEQNADDTWTFSDYMDVNDYKTESTYFAFVYTSTTGGAARWTVDQFEVNLFHPNASGGGNDNLATLPFADDFEGCTTDFNTPAGWTEWFLTDKNDNGFACRQFGVDDSRGVRVSAFNGEAGTIDTWLISANKFDLRELTGGILSFDVRSATAGDGTFSALYSTNYFREGPALATWTELDIADQLPAQGSNTFETVSGAIPGGAIVYVAFRFEGGSQANSASYDIDNVLFEPVNNLLVEGFDSGTGSFTGVSVTGAQVWTNTNFGRTGTGARMNGFSSGAQNNEDWLISPSLNMTSISAASLEFYSDVAFSGPALQVRVSTNYTGGAPSTGTWTTLTATYDTNTANDTWTHSGIINLSAYLSANTRIAFVYTSTTGGAAQYTIDDVLITGN